ncbi:MAG: ATP-dependent helicase [Fibrobacter sp.]|nr:ATP-dependent helicase [Fibrobacter sp.]MBR2212464.1 ATP-dependent helicase [Fibrobacter sp.]
MSNPSPEQQRIIDDTSRIRIVRAAPGSGKTWLVGQIIKKEIENWNKPGGIAALSFTRVGGEEIRNAVGYELSLPHFVGTLDSFLFRYIVKPFWNKIHPDYARPRLIPAECGAEKWAKAPDGESLIHSKKGYNLLKITYSGLDIFNNEILTYKNKYGQGYEIISGEFDWVRNVKRNFIKKSGWMTHADVALCSYRILSDSFYGEIISNVIAKKFPFIVVDELQDTGFFAGKTLLELLKEPVNIKALLVGDPNQAIYEFNGATPSLFNQFTTLGAERQLETSRRCPKSIVSIANCLIPSAMNPNDKENGKNILISYSNFEKDVPYLIEELCNQHPNQDLKFITRLNKTVYSLNKKKNKELTTLGCPALTLMSHAVQAFYQGNNVKALGLAESSISLWLFNYEGISKEELSTKQVVYDDWKRLVVSCLLDSVKTDETLTYEKWQLEVGAKIEEKINKSAFVKKNPPKHLKPTNYKKDREKKGCDEQMSIFFPSLRKKVNGPSLQTIHSVKGQTHDVTVLVTPPIGKGKNRCPSDLWWSNNSVDEEERRVAYVAMTRSRKDFYMIVSKETLQNLKAKQPAFYDCFEVMNIEDFAPEPNWKDLI